MTTPQQQPQIGGMPTDVQPPHLVQVGLENPPVLRPAEPQSTPDDGSIVVRLVTGTGEADIRVPHADTWRSTARSALYSRGDDLFWAVSVLSPEDAERWAELDPTASESQQFFRDWGRLVGQTQGNRADRRAAQRQR